MTHTELVILFTALGSIFVLMSAIGIMVGSLHDKMDRLLKEKKDDS